MSAGLMRMKYGGCMKTKGGGIVVSKGWSRDIRRPGRWRENLRKEVMRPYSLYTNWGKRRNCRKADHVVGRLIPHLFAPRHVEKSDGISRFSVVRIIRDKSIDNLKRSKTTAMREGTRKRRVDAFYLTSIFVQKWKNTFCKNLFHQDRKWIMSGFLYNDRRQISQGSCMQKDRIAAFLTRQLDRIEF